MSQRFPVQQELDDLLGCRAVVVDLLRLAARRRLPERVHLGPRPGVAGAVGLDTEIGEPPPRGETQKIEDDGNAAEQILQFLQERKAL